MLNLFLVVIATQFSATKKREIERIVAERRLIDSNYSLNSISNSCWNQLLEHIYSSLRKVKLQLIEKVRKFKEREKVIDYILVV